jgi:hypothetical protein
MYHKQEETFILRNVGFSLLKGNLEVYLRKKMSTLILKEEHIF